jgi:DNA-binding NarL/FixJ family response regulator
LAQHGAGDIISHPIGSSPSPDLWRETAEPRKEPGWESVAALAAVSDRNAVVAIAVIDEHPFTRQCITKSLQELCSFLDIVPLANCDVCLRNPRRLDLILYHAHESLANSEQLAVAIKNLLEIAPVIILCDVDCIESIEAAFDSGARGYIPTASTTLEIAIEIIHLVKAGGTFVPPSSLSLRRIKAQGGPGCAITTPAFTHRQMAVLGCLKLGRSNKAIAHELQMSESTVKVHIRNIMKKLNARNRTEVACRAHEMAMTGTH